jgi:hypothetical protein
MTDLPARLSFAEMQQMAKLFAESRLFPDVPSMAAAFVKIQAGSELGFGPFASMQVIDIIKGKPQLNANGQAVKVRQSGRYDYDVLEHTDQVCRIEFFLLESGKRRSLGVSVFTLADAQRAKIAGEMYQKFPRNMLFSRAMTNGVAWFCPDAIGMRVYGEGELTDNGEPARIEPPRQADVNLSTGPELASHPVQEMAIDPSPPSPPAVAPPSQAKLPLKAKIAERARASRKNDVDEFTLPGGQPIPTLPDDDPATELRRAQEHAEEEATALIADEDKRHELIDRVLNLITLLVPRNGDMAARNLAICQLIKSCFAFDVEVGDLKHLGQILDVLPMHALKGGLVNMDTQANLLGKPKGTAA